MQVSHAHAVFTEVFGEILRHLLGQGGDQHAVALRDAPVDLAEQVVDLGARRPHLDLGVDQPGRTHHQFDHRALGLRQFLLRRRGRDVDGARLATLELVELERPVVERRRQAEPILDQGLLARPVALVHAAELRERDVGFVDHQQRVRRKIVEQARRRLPRRASGEMARVVLDPLAEPDLGQHLEVEGGALLEPLRLQQLVVAVELLQPVGELDLDRLDRLQHGAPGAHVVGLRVDGVARQPATDLAGERVEQGDRLDGVVEQLDANRLGVRFGREDIDHLAPHAIGSAAQFIVAARVLQFGEPADRLALLEAVAANQVQHHAEVLVRIAEPVDRRNGGHDQCVASLEQGLGRRQTHLLDVLVDRRIFLDVGVAGRDVGLGLVIVVVGNEVLDRVLREELPELAVQLRGQGLVGRQHEGRPLHGLDHVGDGVSLARPGDAEQRLVGEPRLESLDQAADRLGLIAGWRIGGDEAEAIASAGAGGSGGHGGGRCGTRHFPTDRRETRRSRPPAASFTLHTLPRQGCMPCARTRARPDFPSSN